MSPYPNSNISTMMSACAAPPARTRSRPDAQAGTPGRRPPTSLTGPMKGGADEDPSSQESPCTCAGGQAPGHLVDSGGRAGRDDDHQRVLPRTPGDRRLLAGTGRAVPLCASTPQAPAAIASSGCPGQRLNQLARHFGGLCGQRPDDRFAGAAGSGGAHRLIHSRLRREPSRAPARPSLPARPRLPPR